MRMRVVAVLAAILACCGLGLTPAAMASPRPASAPGTGSPGAVLRLPDGPHDTISRKSAAGSYRTLRRSGGPSVSAAPFGQQYYSGYGVTTDSGVDIYKITGDITLPAVSCTETYIGSNGFSMLYSWIGIDGYGTSDVEQTGVEAYCSGTPGDLGTGTASYAAWYTICCYSGWSQTYFSPPAGTLAAGAKLQFTVQWDAATGKYNFTLGYGTNYADTMTESLACPASLTCGFGTAEATMEQPGGEMPQFPLPEWSGGGGWSNVALTASDGTPGTLAALPSYWNSVTFNMTEGSPVVLTGNSTDGYGDPGALNASGNTFSEDCTYYGSESTLNWSSCPASPSLGVDWDAPVGNDAPDYIVGNAHNNRVTWSSAQTSGTHWMILYDGQASNGDDILTFFDGPRNICLDDPGSSHSYEIYEESCSGGTPEEWDAEPGDSSYAGYYVLRNVGTGMCMAAVAGTGDYLNDVTCPAENASDSWNPLWFTG